MAISSLGAGAGILTQDLLDQLREADEAQYIRPLDTRKAAEMAKQDAFNIIEAYMDNVESSLNTLTEYGVFESRTASSSSESVATVSAADSSDIQDFSLEVLNLATKEIVQSAASVFATKESTIATGTGQMELTVGSSTFTIDYDSTTTLEGLKDLINEAAGDSVSATIVQVADGDYRLFVSAKESGTGQDIAIADLSGVDAFLNTALTTGIVNVQDAVDAQFKYNGQTIIRSSNVVDDLLSGVTITLKEAGTTNISVEQNRENIASKIENFISKYNSALYQLNKDTKSSEKVEERGVFSSESTIKNMKSDLINMLGRVGESVGRLQDYGIEVADDGSLSLETSKLNEMLDADSSNVQAFFAGGTFTKSDGSEVELEGAFVQMEEDVLKYTSYNAGLDQYENLINSRLESLTEQRTKAMERLTAKYDIMAKQFTSYDAMITQFNSISTMFTNMVNAESAQ